MQFGSRSGPSPYLTKEEEEELVTFLLRCANIGYPHSRKQVLAIVQNVVDAKGKNVSVTCGWWDVFCKRHSALSLRMAEQLSHVWSVCSSADRFNKYFDLLEQTLEENSLISRPSQVFNCDKTSMLLDPKPLKVVVKHPRAVTSGNKAQITDLASCNAAGYVIPPFVIYDRKTLKPEMCEGEVLGLCTGCQILVGSTQCCLINGSYTIFCLMHQVHDLSSYF